MKTICIVKSGTNEVIAAVTQDGGVESDIIEKKGYQVKIYNDTEPYLTETNDGKILLSSNIFGIRYKGGET